MRGHSRAVPNIIKISLVTFEIVSPINIILYPFSGNEWLPGDSKGVMYFASTSRSITFPQWKPNVWNSFCVSMDALNKTYRMTVNEEIIFTSNVYKVSHSEVN